jgi:hypothetical protein
MEDLMELVAASFARHGIECPAIDTRLVEKRVPTPARAVLEPTAIPDHNYRKSLQGDPAP